MLPASLRAAIINDREKELEEQARQRRYSYYFLAAMTQSERSNYSGMLDCLQHCFAIDPEQPAAHYQAAAAYLMLDQDSMVMQHLNYAIERDPNNPWYLQALASIYLDKRDYEKTIPLAERLSKLQPKRSEILSNLLRLYQMTGRKDEALSTIDRLQTLKGNSIQLTAIKHMILQEKGDTAASFEALRQLCDEFPYDVTCLILSGECYSNVGELDSAKVMYDRAERIDPSNINLQQDRIFYWLQKGDTARYEAMRDSVILDDHADISLRLNIFTNFITEVLDDGEKIAHTDSLFSIITSRPKPPTDFLRLYMSYRRYVHGDGEDDLIPIVLQMYEQLPTDPEIQNALVSYYVERQDYPKIKKLCQEAIICQPGELLFHFYYGVCLLQEKKDKEAINAFTTGLRQKTEESNKELVGAMYQMLGDTYHSLGQEKNAFEAYDSCLVYSPDDASCLNNYAYFLSLKKENLQRAEEMSYRSIKLQPQEKNYLDTYAWILFQMGDYNSARNYMNRAVNPELDDQTLLDDKELNEVHLEHAGDIMAMLNEMDTAVRLWKLAAQKKKPSSLLRKKIKKKQYIKKD